MKKPLFVYAVRAPLAVLMALSSLSSRAANVDWDGGGSVSTWEDAANWSSNVLPTSLDNARLLDVTTGVRTVEISAGSPQTINKLTITQTTSGAVNSLLLNDNLTISLSGSNTPFAITPTAGAGSIVTTIGANKTLLATNSTNTLSNVSFGSTLNLGASSIFRLEALGATSDLTGTTFGGPVNATGAGAAVILQGGRFVQNPSFSGAVSVSGTGSTLTFSTLNNTGAVGGVGGVVSFNGNDGSGNAVNLEAGTEFILNVIGSTFNFANRVNLAAASGPTAGAKLTFGSLVGGSSTRITNFNQGLVLGAGANADFLAPTLSVNLAGTSSLGAGAKTTLKTDNAQGAWNVTNSGTLSMDNASIIFDWAAAGSNTTGNALGRRFINTGTWTLGNASSIVIKSTTGRPTSGFGVGTNNENSGTFNIQDGSTVDFSDLYNTGTMNLGSSTAGASDRQVKLGAAADTATTVGLINGLTSAGVAGAGTINVNGNTLLGRSTLSNTTTLYNGVNAAASFSSTGSTINIGDGTVAAVLTLANSNAAVVNAAGNSVNVKTGGTLFLQSLVLTNLAGSTTINNSGTFTQAGTVALKSTFNGSRSITTNTGGIYKVSGTGAVIEALSSPNTTDPTNVVATSFIVAGRLSGASASDRLTFTNSTGNSATTHTSMTIAVNSGEITPGDGSNGVGTASIGSLNLVNTQINFTGTAKLTLDIGGTLNSGLYDTISLTGVGATFSLSGTNDTLDIRLVNGFLPQTSQTYTIISAASITGQFETLLLNGNALGASEYTLDDTSVPGSVLLTFAAVPEPSTYALIAGGLVLAGCVLRRRRSSTAKDR